MKTFQAAGTSLSMLAGRSGAKSWCPRRSFNVTPFLYSRGAGIGGCTRFQGLVRLMTIVIRPWFTVQVSLRGHPDTHVQSCGRRISVLHEGGNYFQNGGLSWNNNQVVIGRQSCLTSFHEAFGLLKRSPEIMIDGRSSVSTLLLRRKAPYLDCTGRRSQAKMLRSLSDPRERACSLSPVFPSSLSSFSLSPSPPSPARVIMPRRP